MRFSMTKILVIITLATLSVSALADRKPAIEDFVGVETANYQVTPPGSEFAFNFGNHIGATSHNFLNSISTSQMISIIAILGLLTLPFLMWVGIVRSAKVSEASISSEQEVLNESSTEELESGVVTHLQEYREHEEKDKKAS